MGTWLLVAILVIAPPALALVVSLLALGGTDQDRSEERLKWRRRVGKSGSATGLAVGLVVFSLVAYWFVRFVWALKHAD